MPPRAKTLTLDEIADAFGVTTETIRLWRKEGMPTRMQRGRPCFVLRECITWRREKDVQSVEDDELPEKNRELVLRMKAERELKELELAQKRKELIPIGESQEFCEAIAGGFAATAGGQLQRFEREIVKATTPAEARRITVAINAALMQGAQEFADQLEQQAEQEEAEAEAA